MGFKMFVHTGQSGFIYDFFLYSGAKSSGMDNCSAEKVILRLCELLPRMENYKLCFDNRFTTLDLCLKLKELGILFTTTLRPNRLAQCSLMSEKELKTGGLECVHLTSTYCSSESSQAVGS